jgi:hypothetical protein
MKKILALALLLTTRAWAGNVPTNPIPAGLVQYLQTTTSDVQTQLNGKQASLGYTAANKAGDTFLGGVTVPNLNDSGLTISSVVVTDSNDNLVSSGITTSLLNYLSGATANIQTQINSLASMQGITQLNRDVLAGPGAGLQGATVAFVGGASAAAVAAAANALALSPQAIIQVSTANSPYTASANQFIVCNNNSGSPIINLPLSSSVDVNGNGGPGYLGDISVVAVSTALSSPCFVQPNAADTGGINGVTSTTSIQGQGVEKDFKASKTNLEWYAN